MLALLQEAVMIQLFAAARDGFPGGEALIDAVPESDLRLVHLPTEIDELTTAQGRKIEQTEVEIFDRAAMGLNALDQGDECRLHLLRLCILHRRALCPAGIGDHELGGLRLEQFDGQVPPLANQIFDERSQYREQCRRLFEAKHFHAMVLPCRLPHPLFSPGGASSGPRQILER